MGNSTPVTQSTTKALDVLEVIAQYGNAVGVSEVAKKVGMNKVQVFRIANTLARKGYLIQDPSTRRYRLGYKILELAHRLSSQDELRRASRGVMERLSGAVRETVHLGVLDQGEVLYVDSRESPLNSFAASHIGKRNPVHCTALGKAMLAFLPDEEVASICGEKGFRKQTGQTILTLARLRADLAAARRDGYAVDDRELNEGTRCVAAPVRNHDGRVFAALSVSGPVSRVTTEAVPELGRMIAAAAAEISEGLGYVPK